MEDDYFMKALAGPFDDWPIYDATVIFAITARVGSTSLVDAVARSGIASEVAEIFNPRHRGYEIYGELKPDNAQDYLNRYFQRFMRTGRLVFKSNYWDMVTAIPRKDVRDRLFPNLKVIYCYRRDLLAQAYSLWRANSTNVWHVADPSAAIPSPSSAPDFAAIKASMDNLAYEVHRWQLLFEREEIEPLSIAYEDIAADHDAATRAVLDFIGSNAPLAQTTHRKISTTPEDIAAIDELRRAVLEQRSDNSPARYGDAALERPSGSGDAHPRAGSDNGPPVG